MLYKSELLKELKSWDTTTLMELTSEITEIIRDKSETVQLELEYDKYKGSGKCWVANVAEDNKKILNFVDPVNTIINGYKGTKIYDLLDGNYLLCEKDSKSHDKRRYIRICNGKLTDF